MSKSKIVGKLLKNFRIYKEAQKIGFDYILNPKTGELHLVDPINFFGSHNLAYSDLEDFIGLSNIGVRVDIFKDGAKLPVYDMDTGDDLGIYTLNKCRHCFPSSAI